MRTISLTLAGVLLLAAVPALGQHSGAGLFKVDLHSVKSYTEEKTGNPVRMVTVKFTITRQGEEAGDVGKEYKMLIEEDGKEVAREDVPRATVSDDVSVVLCVDISGSMAEHGRMEQARAAAGVFFQGLPTRAESGLILFDHEMRVVEAPRLDRGPLLQHVLKAQPLGGTAYLDAAVKAIDMLAPIKNREKAVVLMTDGVDLNSEATVEKVVARAKSAGVRLYTVGIGEPGKQEKVTSVLVLDRSGSMLAPADDNDKVAKIEALREAALRFVNFVRETNPPVVRSTVLEFSDAVAMPRPFTNNKFTLRNIIKQLDARGETALFDATYTAVAALEAERAPGKRVVVALTDGIDNSSRRRVEEVIQRAKEAKVPLYMLGFGRSGELDEKVMQEMASQTGGKYYHAKNQQSLLQIFENLSIQLHDDGIDEVTLRQLARETKGQYYPAKDVSQLKFILERVTQNIQKKEYVVTFPSVRQTGDGTGRGVKLKLVRLTGEIAGSSEPGRGVEVVEAKEGSYQVYGVVVPEMNPFVYLGLLGVLGALLALPAGVRRWSKPAG